MNIDEPTEPAQYDLLRAALRDVSAPADARETAITAALAVFDEAHPVAADAESAPAVKAASPQLAEVVELHRRRWWTVGVTAAAAAAMVLFIAVGMFRSNSSNVAFSDRPVTTAEKRQVTTGSTPSVMAAPADAGAAPAAADTNTEVLAAGAEPAASSIDEVRAILKSAPAATETALSAPGTVPACVGEQDVVARLVYAGTPALVVGKVDGSLQVVSAADCAPLTSAFRLGS